MRSGAPATIKTIASRLGISHSTVSRSLRGSPLIGEETKRRVLAEAQAMGYVAHGAARQMRGEPSQLIGLLLPDIRPDFFSAITAAFITATAARGRTLLLSISQRDPLIEQSQIRAFREAGVSGILIHPTVELTPESLALLRGIPTVQVMQHHPGIDAPFVGSDDRASMDVLVRHLVGLGHEQIGFIGSAPSRIPGSERLDQFTRTLQALGLPVEPDLIVTGNPAADAGGTAAAYLLDRTPRPTALLVATAPMAEGALEVVLDRGLAIPGDLSFVSFGDPRWHRLWGEGITSVTMPVDRIVGAALAHLLDGGDGVGDESVTFRSEVVLRGTTAPR